jgi:RNA polymerase sigma-70 factor (ECF subfamily)
MRSTEMPLRADAIPTATDSPEALMEAFLAGDTRAFEALYRRLAPRVVGYLRVMSGNAGLAEDLAQTTFLKVHRARDTWQRGAQVEPWVFAIARRTFLDHRRREKRARESLSADGTLPEPMPEGIEPLHGFDRLDDQQTLVIQKRLAALPEPQREALVLLKIEGLSTAEAAAVAGTTQGAIKLRAHRAYESLRQALGVKVKP